MDGWESSCEQIPPISRAPVSKDFPLNPMRYTQFNFWSPTLGCRAARVSMFNGNGEEFFCVVAMNGTGKQNKAERHKALEAIADAIEAGHEPGAVYVS